jgi:3-isopropylmalate dehydratase small subunit
MDPFRRQCLLDGTDEIGLTLTSEAAIAAHEARTAAQPWLQPSST